jgi:CMP-N-acetylneuraminic acid synthetase
MNLLCTICARGGSKGVKNKNIRPMLGRPLIQYTVDQAIASNLFKYISVSSDSNEILEAVSKYQEVRRIQRPNELASDTAGKIPAIRHAVSESEKIHGMKFDVIIDLDCTSPLREASDIVEALNVFKKENAPNLITGMPARRSPYFNMVEQKEDGSIQLAKIPAKPLLRRQDAPACFDMNASIYIWKRDVLFSEDKVILPKTALYVMPEERSWDIDSEMDFEFVEYLLKNKGL